MCQECAAPSDGELEARHAAMAAVTGTALINYTTLTTKGVRSTKKSPMCDFGPP